MDPAVSYATTARPSSPVPPVTRTVDTLGDPWRELDAQDAELLTTAQWHGEAAELLERA
jgi:hypothetical protein